VEILRLNAFKFSLRYLADLEEKKNITEVHLHWVEGPSVKEVLPMLKRCTNLHLLTLTRVTNPCFPPLEELCDFIMELKQLTFLHLIYYHILDCEHFKPEVDEVKEFVLHHRPNFKFYFSCCSKFDESRVSIRGHSHIT